MASIEVAADVVIVQPLRVLTGEGAFVVADLPRRTARVVKRLPHAALIDLTQGVGSMSKPRSDARRFAKLDRENNARVERQRKLAERRAAKHERAVETLARKSGFVPPFDHL